MTFLFALSSYSWYDFSDATVGLLFGVAGVLFGYALRGLIGRFQAEAIEKRAAARLAEADVETQSRLKEADIKARAVVIKAREEFEAEAKARKAELQEVESRLTRREGALDEKSALLDKKDQTLTARRDELSAREEDLQRQRAQADAALAAAEKKLSELAGMTGEEAKRLRLAEAEAAAAQEEGVLIRRAQDTAKATCDREAQAIVATAIQRYAIAHASETMMGVFPLESDAVKGRIIGREGRNIRSIESLTGVTLLVDDTPGAVVISSFDPVRREVARCTLEKLVADGRIHPARIEEVVHEVEAETDQRMLQAGEEAAFKSQVVNVPTEVLRIIGRLTFRTSFSQNVLDHSIEVANLSGMIAGELGLDPSIARRAGFFHDIGKALDHEKQGKHAALGADFLQQNGEDALIVNAVAAHHEDVPAESLYAVVVSAADAISSSRPGARQEAGEVYVERVRKLEEIANSFSGVVKSYALQAGRELRVVVDPGSTDDSKATLLARDIANKIEATMRYPGQIRIIVIRERRCIEYAR